MIRSIKDRFGEGRDFVGMHKGFPTGAAVIGARRIAIGTLGQVRQLLDRMFTERWWILPRPRRLEVHCLSFRHAASSRVSRAHLYRQVGFKQAHTGWGGSLT